MIIMTTTERISPTLFQLALEKLACAQISRTEKLAIIPLFQFT